MTGERGDDSSSGGGGALTGIEMTGVWMEGDTGAGGGGGGRAS